jgi:predicted negative regulator of RcsB-dependent stress response
VTLESSLKLLSILGAVIAFAWGAYQYIENEKKQASSRRVEATKPFLERQLKLYTEATQAAATIATSSDASERAGSTKRFWSLYWGELALVEDRNVEAAMVAFGQALEKGQPAEELQQLSLRLAHACRDSLAMSWGVRDWQNPHAVAAPETRR